MAITFNADTTNGLVITPDTSGNINFQSAGATVATITSSGIDASGLTGSLPAGMGGKVLQVVHANFGTQVLTSSSTYSDSGLTASITPSSTSSKILVIFSMNGVYSDNAYSLYGRAKLVRNSTDMMTVAWGAYDAYTYCYGSAGGNYLDSPATTSATTYKVQIRNDNNAQTIGINTFGSTSNLTLMEIAG